jgi:hypothetical protein
MISTYEILVEIPEMKRVIGTSGHSSEDNIKTALREKEWEGVG